MILFAGLSPAFQQIMEIDSLRPGEVNRAASAFHHTAGKVFNAARAAARLRGEIVILAPLGGVLGAWMKEDLRKMGIEVAGMDVAAPSRICSTVVDRETCTVTELVEPAPDVTGAELELFAGRFEAASRDCSHVVLMGSLPKSVSPGFFRALCNEVHVPVIADVAGAELTEILAIRPRVVKPNRNELGKVLQRDLVDRESVVRGAVELKLHGPECVLVTDGPNPVIAVTEEGVFEFFPPSIECVNPIGSGDALAGGLAAGLEEGKDLVSAIRFGIAASAANAQRLLPMDFTRREVEKLAEVIKLTKL